MFESYLTTNIIIFFSINYLTSIGKLLQKKLNMIVNIKQNKKKIIEIIAEL